MKEKKEKKIVLPPDATDSGLKQNGGRVDRAHRMGGGAMRPAFSNGTEFMFFEEHNCYKCVKASRYNEKKGEYTKFRCKVQEEIIKAAISDGMVSDRVADITHDFTLHGRNCKYLNTERKKYVKQDKNQLELL